MDTCYNTKRISFFRFKEYYKCNNNNKMEMFAIQRLDKKIIELINSRPKNQNFLVESSPRGGTRGREKNSRARQWGWLTHCSIPGGLCNRHRV